MCSTATKRVVDALSQIFTRYAYLFTLKTDNGHPFCGEEFTKSLSDHGVEHRTSPSMWLQANGQVERDNQSIPKSLRIAHVEGKDWREELQKFLLANRTMPHLSTGVTPASLMFGTELRTKLPELRIAENVLDEGVRDRDWSHKMTHKIHAENK